MEVFIEIVENHIQQLKAHNKFDPNALLNINQIKDLSYIMKYYYATNDKIRAKKSVIMKDFHEIRRKISKLRATTDISPDKKSVILKRLEDQFQVSFMAITDCENVNTATAMLFDDKEFRLNPDEEIAKCEAIQVAIIKELQEIEKNTTSIVTKKIIFKKPVKQ